MSDFYKTALRKLVESGQTIVFNNKMVEFNSLKSSLQRSQVLEIDCENDPIKGLIKVGSILAGKNLDSIQQFVELDRERLNISKDEVHIFHVLNFDPEMHRVSVSLVDFITVLYNTTHRLNLRGLKFIIFFSG